MGDGTVVRIRDLAGRPRGVAFAVDDRGTLLTSHEAVDGLACLVLHPAGAEQTWLVDADAVTELPEAGLALVRAGQPVAEPFVVGAHPVAVEGTAVRVHLPRGTLDGEVVGAGAATYTATDAFHLLEPALALTLPPDEELGHCGHPAGAPVVDARTGAVVGVLGAALHAGRSGVSFAVPPRAAVTMPALVASGRAEALREALAANGAAVAAYGGDLNLAGVLRLGRESVARASRTAARGVRRERVTDAFDGFAGAAGQVMGVVGEPGTGRTHELAALGREQQPAVWVRGAELRVADGGLREAVEREFAASAVEVVGAGAEAGAGFGVRLSAEAGGWLGAGVSAEAGAGQGGEVDVAADAGADAAAAVARDAGRPLLVLLDAPEDMPPVLADDLVGWVADTVTWLRDYGARLVVGCRPEFWERLGALFPPQVRHQLPSIELDDLDATEAAALRRRCGVPDSALAPRDARHPLAIRLAGEVRAAVGGEPEGRATRREVFSAYLDLVCLRVAERLAAEGRAPDQPDWLRRLAARVAGRVHEAARRCLGPGQGALEREDFEELFPWQTGWARAVLGEGLLVPAGGGYRFAEEEFAEWLQGGHVDADAALRGLVHRWAGPEALPARGGGAGGRGQRSRPVPAHRIGPVIEALLAVERRKGASELAARLEDLVQAVDTFARRDQEVREEYGEDFTAEPVEPGEWWASRLLAGTLRKLPDAEAYLPVLRLLAERILARAAAEGGLAAAGAVLAPFGPGFWARLPVGVEHRLALLRRLVPADPARPSAFLTAAGDLLRAEPGVVQPLLLKWFDDDRQLPGAEGATVADAAQALLHTLRGHAVDDLADALLDCGHPRAEQLLAALCEDETPAMCRAVDRWSHDRRPERHTAAAAYGMKTAPHARTAADRELLRYAAQALLALPEEWELYGPALVILVRNKDTRAEYLAHALTLFAAGDVRLPAASFVPALASHPEEVLRAFRARLHEPGLGAGEVLDALARVRTPAALARRAAALVREYATHHPEGAGAVARYFDRRLEDGAAARSILHPLGVELITTHPPAVRRALAAVVAAPGSRESRPLRRELLAVLLDRERDPGVLDALLVAAASGSARRADWRTRDLVHRLGLLGASGASGASAAEGAAAFDLRLVSLAREHPGFGRLLRSWLDEAPEDWSAVIGPSAQVSLGAEPRQAG